jgi:RNA polymerase sigma-B factor
MGTQNQRPSVEAIWAQYRNAKTSHDQTRLKNQLVAQHTRLARKMAHRSKAHCPEDYEDLEQLALIGLMKAISAFDPDRNVAFSSFAVPYIRGEILHFLRDHYGSVKIPRRAIELRSKVRRLRKKMLLADVELSEAQVAEGLGVSPEKWREIDEMCDRKPLAELDDERLPVEEAEDASEEYAAVRRGLSKLPNPYRACLLAAFFGQVSHEAIAKAQGVSVRQIQEWIGEGLKRIQVELEISNE